MKPSSFFLLLTLMSLFACRSAEIPVDPCLNASAITVKVRNGFQIGQVIRYGEFRIVEKVVGAVSTINRGKVWIDESLYAETRTVIAA